jgi:5-formyltetrahydrofolate cyclo-ligase
MLKMMDSASNSPDTERLNRAKSELRLRARAARRTVLPEMRTAAAYAIAERVLNLPELIGASAVMLYGASPEEADPGVLEFALREIGVRIAYPRITGPRILDVHWVDDPGILTTGPFGLTEPTEAAPLAQLGEISAIIVPGIAFDADGNRLGFGGGYYDSLLAHGGPTPPTIGIAYDEQLVDHVPHDAGDRPVAVIVTPTRMLRAPTSRL